MADTRTIKDKHLYQYTAEDIVKEVKAEAKSMPEADEEALTKKWQRRVDKAVGSYKRRQRKKTEAGENLVLETPLYKRTVEEMNEEGNKECRALKRKLKTELPIEYRIKHAKRCKDYRDETKQKVKDNVCFSNGIACKIDDEAFQRLLGFAAEGNEQGIMNLLETYFSSD